MKRVVMIQRVACDYRQPFFEAVRQRLYSAGVLFEVAAGQPWPHEGLVDILDNLDFGIRTRNRRLCCNAYWETGALKAARGADLVIMEQANSALHLYPLLLNWVNRKGKIAFYGHGAHLNSEKPEPLKDAWRAFWLNRVNWWFAYTDLTRSIVEKHDFPHDRITTVNNAVDTEKLRREVGRVSPDARKAVCRDLFGAAPEELHIGLFCGRFTPSKKIPFLLEAADQIRKQDARFALMLIGDGADADLVDAFCKEHSWCRWLSALRGAARAPYLAVGDMWLNPGMTGLGILDAFAAGMPFFTTNNRIHSPEIAYLQPGKNGMISAFTVSAYVATILECLADNDKLKHMRERAKECGHRYTIASMAERFSVGILEALQR